MYKFSLSTIFIFILFLSSCSSEKPNALTESDAEAFLQRVELEDKTLGPKTRFFEGINNFGLQKNRFGAATISYLQFYIGF